MHITSLSKTPIVMDYVLTLSQFLYQLIASEVVTQELLSSILEMYRNSEMLVFYKTDAFKANMRQMMSVLLLQVAVVDGDDT